MDTTTQTAAAPEPMLPPLPAGPWARATGLRLSEQLAERLAQRIAQRLLGPGARLPSVRASARHHGLSPSTVVAAYDLLQARGLVEARPQRGFFVRDAPASSKEHALTSRSDASGSRVPRAAPLDATALVRSMVQAQGAPPAPGLGTLPAAWLDAPLLQRALRRVCSAGHARGWLDYGDPAGDPGLRTALSRRLADLGVAATAGQIVTTVGATHALDLVARTLLQPGDAVLVDEPGWAVEYARLERMGMRLLPVPRGSDGPDMAVMEALLQAHAARPPRLYVTVSVLHNPTGASLSPAAAHRVLQLAATHGFQVVEDDTYAFLAPAHATRMAQLDGLQRCIYVSGFSKVLAPQWRVGFVAAAPALARRLADTKLLSTLGTPTPLEQALATCLDQGALRRHAERLVQRVDSARTRCVRLVHEAGFRFAAPPQGLFGWVDVGMDTDALAQQLLDDGWLTAPGSLFHARPRPGTLMRINFASAQQPAFWLHLQALRVRTSAQT